MKSLEAVNLSNNMIEIMCVVKEVKAYNGATVIFHPKELTLEEIELMEKKAEIKFEEDRQRKRNKKRNLHSTMAAAMALHTLLGV